ncbi:hypothetical protein Anapl_03460 [Anas platyrhynchos]|uniref:Uncharacterized protein n=1 Tax=Anas platyrhynchos TaxID=8839 RepID=R0L3L2_ANAPL|nr:hypothetical protein Anapl_03460 [Anas platyrhynchos]
MDSFVSISAKRCFSAGLDGKMLVLLTDTTAPRWGHSSRLFHALHISFHRSLVAIALTLCQELFVRRGARGGQAART